jgi:hypothetical protein
MVIKSAYLSVLDRFWLQILPEIHNTIQWLDLESLYIEPILFAASYPNLFGLGLYHIDEKTATRIFNGMIFDFSFF